MAMNETERKAYSWLIKQGTKKDQIKRLTRGSDFLISDKYYEVKRLHSGTIYFSAGQYDRLSQLDPTFLVFDDGDEPVAVNSLQEVESKFKVQKSETGNFVRKRCTIPFSLLTQFDDEAAKRGYTRSEALRQAIRRTLEIWTGGRL